MNENNLALTMEVPRYEYARLIRDSERMRIVTKLIKTMDSYDVKKVVDVLFDTEEEDG